MSRAAFFSAFFVAVCVACASAAVVQRTAHDEMVIDLTFDSRQFSFERVDGYDLIRADGMAMLPEEGAPALPRCPMHITVPYDARVADVRIVDFREVEFAGRFNILPAQPPAILSSAPAGWVDGDPAIYARNTFYPVDLLQGVKEGFMGNSRILSFYVSPLRWNPITGSMMLVKEMQVSVSLEAARPDRPVRRANAGHDPIANMVERIVSNPGDVVSFSPEYGPAAPTQLPAGDFEYVIITVDSLVGPFEPLIDWKSEKGVPATCVTSEWIEANYAGENIQDMYKAFIIDAYQTWGTAWFLMGADTDLVPSRSCYAMDAEQGIAGNKIRSDLFYSDLDNFWNDDGTTPYGEVEDNVDMYPDVFVGRAPANSVADVMTFVDKVLLYEKTPPADYCLKMLMTGDILWANPFTDAGLGLDMIDEDCVPPRYDPILKLYQAQGNETRESVLAAICDGQNYHFHDGHCFWYVMGAGEGSIFIDDADTVSNYPRNLILNSIGCWPAALDYSCIAEHFINNPDGGCVAFIGNCRYGWGSPGNPGFGYSDRFQYEFAWRVFVEEDVHLGLAHALAKARFVPFAGYENVYRYCEYQLNLLGDPEMPLWTDEPLALDADLPENVMATDGALRVVASDSHGACAGAMVCITNGDDVYLRAESDLSGSAEFTVNTASPESLLVTVSTYNHVPFQTKVNVVTEGVHLAYTDCRVVDGADEMANPGETVLLNVGVKNYGTEDGEGVSGLLRSADILCTVNDSTVYYGLVQAGQEIDSGTFEVSLGSGLENGDVVMLELTLTDTIMNVWTMDLPLVVAAPVLEVTSYGIEEVIGDGDFVIEPGEEILITLQISNAGLTYATATAEASTIDPNFSVADSMTTTGIIYPGSSGFTLHTLSVSGGAPEPHVGLVTVDLQASDGSSFADSIYVSVGDLWFADDCEMGDGNWTRAGSPDLWHLTSYRAHSGTHSWYFGYDDTHVYPGNADGSITSAKLMAGEENTLSLWYWYNLTTYGSDGVYVIIHAVGEADTVEFIGSGGALNNPPEEPLNIHCDWVEWSMELPDLIPGDSVWVEFGFYSDSNDEAEGVYLDDIAFRSWTPVMTGVGGVAGEITNGILAVFPNPVYDEARILMAPHSAAMALTIYDVEGRFVSEVMKPAGAGSVSWNLKDAAGRPVAPGIYLAKIKGDAYSSTSKIVVLR